MSDLHNKPGENMDGLPSYQDLENAVLNGATAIHCLTAERNQLRVRLESQDLELIRLRTANEDLRRQIAVIGESYMRFASSCVTQLQCVGQAMQQMEQTQTESSDLRA